MLAAFRSFAKSPWAVGLLGLLIISFAVFGIGDVFKANLGQSVIKAGSRTVEMQEFKAAYTRYRKGLEQQYGQPISVDLAVQQGVDKRLLDEMAENEAFNAVLERFGIRAPKALVDETLTRQEAFFNPITGKFDQDRFVQVLQQYEITPEIYMKSVRDELVQGQYVPAAFGAMRAPRAYAALGGALAMEQRDLAYFRLTPASIGQITPPTDAEMTAFMKANAAQLTKPEYRSFSIVRLSRKAFEPGVTVDPAEVQKRFEFEKDSLGRAELRTVVQINVKDAGQAAAVAARLNKGESAAVVAGSIGEKPVRFDDKPRSAFFDPAVADAAFKLPQGGVSAPIRTQFGLAVLKVEKIAAGQAASLEQHRAELEAKVRQAAADRKVSDASKIYEDSHAAGQDMAVSAAKAGLSVVKIPAVAKDGRGLDGKPALGVSQAVLQAVFEGQQGVESEILSDGEGEYFIVRVDTVVPPALRSLEEVRQPLTVELMRRKIADAQQAKADELAARIRKGESLDAVAASAGLKVERIAALSQPTAQQHAAAGRELLGGAFGAKKGEVFIAPAQGQGYAIAVVTAIRAGDIAQAARLTEAQREQFTEMLRRDLDGSARRYAVEEMKAKKSQLNARIAMGMDATAAAAGLTDQPAAKADDKAKK
ncbi:MAG: SurA N-terminal domain-containing protein [Caulobacter sp.]|nr:SurA N-terminal domain-containing protein [Caulobacter sp.]